MLNIISSSRRRGNRVGHNGTSAQTSLLISHSIMQRVMNIIYVYVICITYFVMEKNRSNPQMERHADTRKREVIRGCEHFSRITHRIQITTEFIKIIFSPATLLKKCLLRRSGINVGLYMVGIYLFGYLTSPISDVYFTGLTPDQHYHIEIIEKSFLKYSVALVLIY